MKKRLLSILLVLVMYLGLLPAAASAVQSDDLTISFKTAVYSISKETFVRWVDEPASQDECGEDEYVTVAAVIENSSGTDVPLQNLCISIDGGEKLYWKNNLTIEAGKGARFHVYHVNEKYLTPGLHTATVYASDEPLYSGRFSIGRAWSEIFQFPTDEQIAARPADGRSPYVVTWLSTGGVKYDAYCVDFKSDHIPYGTYSCMFNGFMDYSSLSDRYVSVDNNEIISLYGGLQQGAEGKESNSILSFWDIYCTDSAGNTTVIRPKQVYSLNKTDGASFTGEGDGAHTLLPYEWKAGRWYRMLLRCGTNGKTGNTTVEQWFQDLTTGDWTHTCTYDIGVKDSSFIGSAAIFSENFLKQYAGGVRSLEFTNVRIHTDEGWRDVVSTTGDIYLHTTGSHTNAYGSWEAGADQNTFYYISTGVPGWGRTENTGKLTVQNRESGAPLGGPYLQETVRFDDVATDAYYAGPVSWAVEQGITSGTSKTTFSPNANCTAAQILTFLWRANGSPKPAGSVPFSDVKSSDYYADAAAWAYEKGIISGGTFGGNTPCTRSMAVTYMWKAAGSPSAGTASFTDVPSGADYAQAVAWAVEKGVTSGTSSTTFSPDSICTRGQIVTFLYRELAKQQA